MTPTRRSHRKTRLPAPERRARLVDAAWELITADGPGAVSIDAVVRKLGISRPIFYRHFDDRNDVLAAVYDRYAEEHLRHQRQVFEAGGDLDELVANSLRAYLDMVGEHGVMIRAVIHEAHGDPRMDEARARLRHQQLELWRGGSARQRDRRRR